MQKGAIPWVQDQHPGTTIRHQYDVILWDVQHGMWAGQWFLYLPHEGACVTRQGSYDWCFVVTNGNEVVWSGKVTQSIVHSHVWIQFYNHSELWVFNAQKQQLYFTVQNANDNDPTFFSIHHLSRVEVVLYKYNFRWMIWCQNVTHAQSTATPARQNQPAPIRRGQHVDGIMFTRRRRNAILPPGRKSCWLINVEQVG